MKGKDFSSNSDSLGQALIAERKKKNIPLEKISQRTNISLKCLQALESGNYDLLPGDFYIKTYIKSYLKVVGGNEKTFFEIHREALEKIRVSFQEKENVHYSKLMYTRFKGKDFFSLLLWSVVIFAVLFAFGYISKRYAIKSGISGSASPVPAAMIPPVPGTDSFSLDYWPIQVDIEFLDRCWMQVYRGQTSTPQKISEQVYQKGDKVKITGYTLQFLIGVPSVVRFFVNNREISYLREKSKSTRITVNPQKIQELIQK